MTQKEYLKSKGWTMWNATEGWRMTLPKVFGQERFTVREAILAQEGIDAQETEIKAESEREA